jgi:hypothetical protein
MPRPARTSLALLLPLLAAPLAAHGQSSRPGALDADLAARFAGLALACVAKEYPNKPFHVMGEDADALPPRRLTPAFFGCFDWHSSVHGHWLLARLAHLFPEAPFAADARAALSRSLTPANLAAEVDYLRSPGQTSFERPYGLAWLLALAAELRAWDDPAARELGKALSPLEAETASRLSSFLPSLRYPIRSGEHSQTAFALGLALDWARVAGDEQLERLFLERARSYYLADRACPLSYEPSGEDFLSPCLAEADLMRRVLPPRPFARWLSGFLPTIPVRGGDRWLSPGVVTDRADPRLAHIDGLNLSRAFMLLGIASGLPAGDARLPALGAAAARHAAAALPAVTGEHYEGGHWLGTFAVYLTTEAGLGHSAR